MKLVPMRFKGFEWRHNPAEISFECAKKVNELKSPNGGAYIQNMERNNMVVKGKGQLFGEDCLEQLDRLFRLFRQGGAGVLSIDKIEPLFAVFESLKILGRPKPDLLEYEFVFREVMEKKQKSKLELYTVGENENLWDVSYITGIGIDALVRLNPEIKRPDEIISDFEVRLC